jgi:hypothetical protein
MSMASMLRRSSISRRISLVQGSAPKMPTRRLVRVGIDALLDHLVGDGQHVGRRAA